MESHTYIKYLRISPKKLRFIVDDIKKRKPTDALTYLFYSPERSAKFLYKVIKSAVDSATIALKTDASLLQFKRFTVEEGPRLKRSKAGGRGTMSMYKRRMSHVKLTLSVKTVAKNIKNSAKKLKTEKA